MKKYLTNFSKSKEMHFFNNTRRQQKYPYLKAGEKASPVMEINFTWLSNGFAKNISHRELSDLYGYSKQELTFRIAICVINVIFSFTALFGNSAFLITIWKTSSLHSVANIFLASLAVSDLAVGLIVQPLFIAKVLSGVYIVGIAINVLWRLYSPLQQFQSIACLPFSYT